MENNKVEQELDLNQLMLVRKEKLDKLKQEGKDPYTITKFNRTHTSKQIIDNYDELEGKDVTVAGRIMAKRIMGKASFCHIQDSEGKIQSYVSINDLGEEILVLYLKQEQEKYLFMQKKLLYFLSL